MELARDRQARDLARQRKSHFPYRFDEDEAAWAVEFFPDCLRHWKGPLAGQRFELSPWQAEYVIGPLFGWKRLDGTRRFRVAWIELPRKNGKSTMGAGMGFLLALDEPGGEVYTVATKKDQARIIFRSAQQMLAQSAELQRIFRKWAHAITVPHLNATFQALGADSDTQDGLNPSGVLADEIHAWKERHLWDVMVTGMVGREQSMMAALTTAGICRDTSIGWELHNKATNVLDGNFDDEEFFAFISHADKGDDFEDPRVWAKANPNLGVSVFEDRIAKQLEEAKSSPAFMATFLRYHLNLWTDEAEKALSLEGWEANSRDPFPDLSGRPCFAGLDLASTTDLTALVLFFPPVDKGDTQYWVLPFFWLPEATIEERSKVVPYSTWARQGLIQATPGAMVDYQFVQKKIKDLGQKYQIQEIGYDPWGGWETASRLADAGFRMVKVLQSTKTLSAPTKRLIGLVKGHNLGHDGHAVLRWNMHNLVLKEDSDGNVKPDRKRSPEKIDGAVATIIAISRAMLRDSNIYVSRSAGDGPVIRTLG